MMPNSAKGRYGYITHTLQIGDSLQRLAITYNLVDWRELVYLNNLEPPYVDTSAVRSENYRNNSKVAKVGDSILIPAAYQSPVASSADINLLERYAYGADLDIFSYDETNIKAIRMDEKGELSADKLGDLAIATGVQNLRQRLIIRLSVHKGSFILHPEFGSELHTLIGLPWTAQNVIKIQLEVQKNILSDPFVQGVSDIEVAKVEHGTLMVDCGVAPVPPYKPFKFSESITVLE
ncbi:MAG: DUF2634 domain-containing protein [Lachnospiraceae bacterium]|nr:DUF2634 domain-containing protein [Lachnospiraceae bacterium]